MEREKMNFTIGFQYAIVRLAMEDESFFLKADKFFDFNPFPSEILWFFFELIRNHYKEFKKLPGKVPILDEMKKIGEDKLEQYKTVLAKIMTSDISDADYIKRGLEGFVKEVRFKVAYDEAFTVYNEKTPDEAYALMDKTMKYINSVKFEDDFIYTPNDIINVLNEQTEEVKKKVRTGIHALDKSSNGGPGAGEVFTVLARDGVGKSMFLMNVGAIALLDGKKVLHIHCEGKMKQPLLRYCSRITQISYSNILTNKLNDEDIEKINGFKNKYSNNLVIKPFLGMDTSTGLKNTIQDLMSYCGELKKKFNYDVIIVDYGDKLDTKNKTEAKRFVWLDVWQGLEAMSKEFDVPVFTASQAQRIRGSGSKPLKKENMAEAIDKARLSSFCMSINRTENDVANEKVRFYIDKVRDGQKNIYVECDSDYTRCVTHLEENQIFEMKDRDDLAEADDSDE